MRPPLKRGALRSIITHDLSAFEGHWVLQPDECRYEFGVPPRQGAYTIELLPEGKISLASTWISAGGRSHELRFTSPVDGKPYPLIGSRIADAIQLDYVSPTRLNSSAWRDGRKVMWAERILVLPDTLRIDVHGFLANGDGYANRDVYRRHSG